MRLDLKNGLLRVFDVDHGQCAPLTMPSSGGNRYVLIDSGHATAVVESHSRLSLNIFRSMLAQSVRAQTTSTRWRYFNRLCPAGQKLAASASSVAQTPASSRGHGSPCKSKGPGEGAFGIKLWR